MIVLAVCVRPEIEKTNDFLVPNREESAAPFRFRETLENRRLLSHRTGAKTKKIGKAFRKLLHKATTGIASAAKTYMKNGLMYGSFDLSTEKKVFSGNGVAVPRIGRGGLHSRELVQWLSEWV